MRCQKCGTENPSDRSYCNYCSGLLTQESHAARDRTGYDQASDFGSPEWPPTGPYPPRAPGDIPAQPYYDGSNKGGLSAGAILGIVLGAVFLVGAIIAAIVLFIALDDDSGSSIYDLADTDEGVDIMYFEVNDGTNIDEERGCFFLIRAGKGVDIDPSRYSFYVTEKGFSPHLLDFTKREYNDADPYGPRLDSGDLNGSYNWKEEGDLLSDGECIGFDMPMPDMNIDIKSGNMYEVMIKNPKGERIYSDTFVYKAQGWA